MSDEEQLREELRRQEELAEKRALTPKPNPLGEEHLRKIKEFQPESDEEREKRQAKNREDISGNNGHPETPGFDSGSQKGISWRSRQFKMALHYFAKGATYEWVIWKLKRTGMRTETARSIVEDALEEEPEPEPKGAPKKK